jgi:hypothetical protein
MDASTYTAYLPPDNELFSGIWVDAFGIRRKWYYCPNYLVNSKKKI